MEEVTIIAQMCGDYGAFHEVSITPMYDLTNDIKLDDYTLEELEDMVDETGEYCDYSEITAYKEGDAYYMKISY